MALSTREIEFNTSIKVLRGLQIQTLDSCSRCWWSLGRWRIHTIDTKQRIKKWNHTMKVTKNTSKMEHNHLNQRQRKPGNQLQLQKIHLFEKIELVFKNCDKLSHCEKRSKRHRHKTWVQGALRFGTRKSKFQSQSMRWPWSLDLFAQQLKVEMSPKNPDPNLG